MAGALAGLDEGRRAHVRPVQIGGAIDVEGVAVSERDWLPTWGKPWSVHELHATAHLQAAGPAHDEQAAHPGALHRRRSANEPP